MSFPDWKRTCTVGTLAGTGRQGNGGEKTGSAPCASVLAGSENPRAVRAKITEVEFTRKNQGSDETIREGTVWLWNHAALIIT